MSTFSTAYLPCISYIAEIMKDEDPTIEINETYHKQTYRNRCKVMTASGVQILSIPVIKTFGNHSMTKDVRISYVEPWQQIHSRCLQAAYKSSPYFDHYFPKLEQLFTAHFDSLIELNELALMTIFKILKIEKTIRYTTDYEKNTEHDLRDAFNPKKPDDSRHFPSYYQVFEDRQAFAADLSIVDLLFNEGPESIQYLKALQ